MIVIDQVSKYFGSAKAVAEVTFAVEAGETFVLLGTSGCGKTTMLRMINRLLESSAGNIAINGKPVTQVPPEILRRQIGYVLQHTGLFPHYTIAENMATVPRLLRWKDSRIRLRAQELLEKLHLSPDYLALYPHQLSGGQQQRVGLARALMADPPVLLMDEPFGALDPVTRSAIRQEFKSLDELKRKTIVMVTHDVPEAFELGDRIGLMDKGRLVQVGTPTELLVHSQGTFVQSFLQEQRLKLQFKAIKLADLGNFEIDHFPADISLWDALTALLAPNGPEYPIRRREESTGEFVPVNFRELLAAVPSLTKS
jgi:osmoprotectant transport system ATP-binding protein